MVLLPRRVLSHRAAQRITVGSCAVLLSPLIPLGWGIGCAVRGDPDICLMGSKGALLLTAAGAFATGLMLCLCASWCSCR